MSKDLATRIVDKMMAEDKFSQWLGIQVLVSEKGHSVLKMKIREEMVNGFGIAHGGICFSFADSALAFASNSYGRLSVALECSISFPVAVNAGDELTCEAKELSLTNRTATYIIEVKNQKQENVAFFKGTVYRTSKEWFPEDSNSESLPISKNTDSTKGRDDNDGKLIFPDLSYTIACCAYDVFNKVGGGHKESVYQKALRESFLMKKLKIKEQIFYEIKYGEKSVGKNFFDFLVDEKIIVEIKSISNFSKANYDRVLNYLHVSKLKLALLINFKPKEVLVKRVINFELVNPSKS